MDSLITSSTAAGAASPPAAAGAAPPAGAEPTLDSRDPISLSPRHLANREGQMGSISTPAAVQSVAILSAVTGISSS